MTREKDDFDFMDQILPHAKEEDLMEPPFTPDNLMGGLSYEEQVKSSYLLVNALMNLLLEKGIIEHREINSLLGELYKQYRQKKGE